MKNKVFMLLDRSGSMETMWKEALAGVNNYVADLEESNPEVVLAVFDTNGYDVIRSTTAREWKKVTTVDVYPRGGTPLLDAAGRIMWSMLDSCADRAMLVIMTDGHENASKKFTSAEVKDMTKQLTSVKNYDMVFLGANFDKIGDVASTNFGWNDDSRVMATSKAGFGDAMASTSAATRAYLRSGNRAQALYSSEDMAKAKA